MSSGLRRVFVLAGAVVGTILGVASKSAQAMRSERDYCEKDRCIFGYTCQPAVEKTGCAMNLTPIGTCKTYDCDET